MMRIELFSRKPVIGRPKWYFRILATNGNIVAQSEAYSRRLDAKSTAEHMKEGLSKAPISDA